VKQRFTDGDSHDIKGVDPFSELRVLREIIREGPVNALQALEYVRSLDCSFPSTEIIHGFMLYANSFSQFWRLQQREFENY
jgi:hypothetical protein